MKNSDVATETGDQTAAIELIMEEADAGSRIDVALARRLPDLSRARVQALLREGHIRHKDGRTIESHGVRVKLGDGFSVLIPPAAAPEPEAENIPLIVLFEDKHLIVIDKPKGLVVHPAPGHATGTTNPFGLSITIRCLSSNNTTSGIFSASGSGAAAGGILHRKAISQFDPHAVALYGPPILISQ